MRTQLIKLYHDIQASYWFIPLLMVFTAVALSFGTNYFDRSWESGWLNNFQLLNVDQPEGARVLLSTIAASMITVAGVTFSMTIVSVSFVSSQFGPRLIGNFMRDKGNQVTLGTFIATFVYCLLTLLSVRNAEEGPGGSEDLIVAFVPHFSILFALGLAMASVIVLIYFIHHIPETINISNITGKIGNQLKCDIRAMFPEKLGDEEEDDDSHVAEFPSAEAFKMAAEIRARSHGFIETLDEARLMNVASQYDLLIRLQYRPGDFTTENDVVMLVVPAERLTENISNELCGCLAFGQERTPSQNILFLSDQLVEMIARALSPGLNDPHTAINCMNWLKCALRELGQRKIPDHRRHDQDGKLRIVTYPITFRHFCESILEGARPYVCEDLNASLHMLKVIADVGADMESENIDILLSHAKRLSASCKTALRVKESQDQVTERFLEVKRIFENHQERYVLKDDQGWLGGTG